MGQRGPVIPALKEYKGNGGTSAKFKHDNKEGDLGVIICNCLSASMNVNSTPTKLFYHIFRTTARASYSEIPKAKR